MKGNEIRLDFAHRIIIRDEILRGIAINYVYADFLFNKVPDKILNEHWSLIRYNFFKLIVLDLAKLFINKRETHKLNFFTFLNQLESPEYRNLGIAKTQIESFRGKLNKYTNTFKGIEKIRDKTIAHTDNLSSIAPNKTFFPIVKEIINLGFEILNECSKVVLQKEVINIMDNVDLKNFNIE